MTKLYLSFWPQASSLTEASPERRHRGRAADVSRGRSRRVDLDDSTETVVVERLLAQELTCVKNKAGLASQPEHTCQLAEAARGWRRLPEAGGRPELDLANWPKLLGGWFPHGSLPLGGSPCSGCTAHSSWHSSSSDRTKPHTPCTACAYRPSGTVPCHAASPSHPRQRSAISAWCCCSVRSSHEGSVLAAWSAMVKNEVSRVSRVSRVSKSSKS